MIPSLFLNGVGNGIISQMKIEEKAVEECGFAPAKHETLHLSQFVATLALGLSPRQGLVKVCAKSETWESHFMFLGV